MVHFVVGGGGTLILVARGGVEPKRWLAAAEEAGVGAVALSCELDDGDWSALAAQLMERGIPVPVLESPGPRRRWSNAELSALDREESRTAVEAAKFGLLRAAELGAGHVVLQLGSVEVLRPDWVRLRERFVRGGLDDDVADEWMARRRRAVDKHLDAARRALDALLPAADASRVTLCLRNGARFIDLPTAMELEGLRGEFSGAPLAGAWDMAAGHLQDVMGFVSFGRTQRAFGTENGVSYVGDAAGPVGALGPGRGDLRSAPWRTKRAGPHLFSPWRGLSLPEALAAHAAFAPLVGGA